ncbi:PRC-barrel domain-containing protein [Falsiroseomonas sp.]|uniref:PRC-barrel domain-containing protein n=1 Tax=Falsiroseomonas sp. TaxID=2870721 RepID=UPI00356132F6
MMLWRSSVLIGSSIQATDGRIGSIADLLFEDEGWHLRWAVVDTGTWLPGRKVLLPTACLGSPQAGRDFPVGLTRRQVEESPAVDFDAPVSRQLEAGLYGHYGQTPYWDFGVVPAAGITGPAPLPLTDHPRRDPDLPDPDRPPGDPHLRSANEVAGYHIHASDGDIGHVEEFLVDCEAWVLRYVVVDTRNWWPGRKVLVGTKWFHAIDWRARRVSVDLTRAQVKASPDYDPTGAPARGYEEQLHAHYGLPPYWP